MQMMGFTMGARPILPHHFLGVTQCIWHRRLLNLGVACGFAIVFGASGDAEHKIQVKHAVASESNLRLNGDPWFQIGPAILGQCQKVELLEYDGTLRRKHIIDTTSSDRNFASVKSWIERNIASKLGYSERIPQYTNAVSQAYVILYADKQGCSWTDFPQTSFATKDGKSVLLIAPLCKNFMGPNFKTYINEIRNLMKKP